MVHNVSLIAHHYDIAKAQVIQARLFYYKMLFDKSGKLIHRKL